jgi:hypothetical protein
MGRVCLCVPRARRVLERLAPYLLLALCLLSRSAARVSPVPQGCAAAPTAHINAAPTRA